MRYLVSLPTVLALLVISGAASASIIYSEDFEDGTADGFTLPSLWGVTANFPASGTNALGFVQGESAGASPNGNFNIGNTGQQTAISPLIVIPSSGTTILMFDAWNDGECGTGITSCPFDRLWAEVTDGITTTIIARSTTSIAGSSTLIPDDGASYTPVSVDLNALGFGGSSINIRYNFDSIDSILNSFPGARIDNIQVSTTAVPEPTTLLLMGLGLAGLGFARRRRVA